MPESAALQQQSSHVSWCASNFRVPASDHAAALRTAHRCGFVVLSAAVDPEHVSAIRRALLKLLADAPDSPLLARLRPSDALPNATLSETWHSHLASARERLPTFAGGRGARPWLHEAGRAMLDMPFAPPYNASAVVDAAAPLVDALLGVSDTTTLGAVVEQAAHIMVGPRTGAQQPHSDAAHASSVARARYDAASLMRAAATSDPAAAAAFAATRARVRSGEVTYALNVQLPLHAVRREDGPTALCPATHSEIFCERFMGGACRSGGGGGAPHVDAVAQLTRYAAASGLCGDGQRVLATMELGDALVYDSRLLHWGSASTARPGAPRHVISFTFAQAWYTEVGRDLSPEAVDEAVRWRTRRRRGDDPGAAPGALSAARLRQIHDGMRQARDAEERRASLQLAAMVGMGVLWLTTSSPWRRRRPAVGRKED